MILDKNALFADALDVGGTPNDLDLGSIRPGPGKCLTCFITVDEGVTGMTGWSLQDSDDGSTFEAYQTYTGDLAGKTQQFEIPSDVRRHVRLNLAGTVSGGNWSAGIVLPGIQTAE